MRLFRAALIAAALSAAFSFLTPAEPARAQYNRDATPSTQTITAQDAASTSTTYFNGQVWYSGTPTAGSVAQFSLPSFEDGMLQISGTWTGTLESEISVDGGATWIAHAVHQIGSDAFESTFTNNVVGSLNLAAKTHFRVRANATWTGTATIRFIESANDASVYVANAIKLASSGSLPGYAPAAPTVGASASITSLVLKATPTSSPGGVAYFHAENATTTGGYCVLYNATAAPGAGALTAGLVLAFQALPASGYCDLDSRTLPISASAGAVVLLTSAANPYTYTTGAITGSIYGLAQ